VLETILNSRVLATLIWAALILIALYKFEKPICVLIGRIKAAKSPGGATIEFGEPRIDLPKEGGKGIREFYTYAFGVYLASTIRFVMSGFQVKNISDILDTTIAFAKGALLNQAAESLEQMKKNLLARTCELSEADRDVMLDNLKKIGKSVEKDLKEGK